MALLELDDAFLRDERFSMLGELTGRGKWDARARVEALWFDCILKTKDVRSADEIENFTGWFDSDRGSFAELMVRAKLAERVPSSTKQDGGETEQLLGYRIRGVAERMEWLVEIRKKRAESGALGGKKTASKSKRGKNGQFLPADDQANSKQVLGENQGDPSKSQQKPTLPVPGPGSVPGSIILGGGEKNFAEACKATWQGTLDHFKTGRRVSLAEETIIGRAIRTNGAELVDLALYGARYEPKYDDFDPKTHVSISRVLEPDREGKIRIDKFANWGGQAREREKAKQDRPASLSPIPDSVPDLATVKEQLGRWSKSMKSIPGGKA